MHVQLPSMDTPVIQSMTQMLYHGVCEYLRNTITTKNNILAEDLEPVINLLKTKDPRPPPVQL